MCIEYLFGLNICSHEAIANVKIISLLISLIDVMCELHTTQ